MSNFICEKCPLSFTYKGNLSRHMKKVHHINSTPKKTKNSFNKSKLLNEFEIIDDIEIIECQSYTEILQAQAIRHANELQAKDVKIKQLELEYQKKQELLAEKSTPSYTEILQAQAIRHANELQEKDVKIQQLEFEYQKKLMLLNKKLNII